MFPKLGYHGSMHRLNQAIGAALGGIAAFVLIALQTPTALAQINAAPPSVTSMGFGGRTINSAPPSVTSLGPHGYSHGFNSAFPNSRPLFYGNHHHHRDWNYPWGGVYGVPSYGYDDYGDNASNGAPDDQYNGGPTIFDRRGSGTAPRPPDSYRADAAAASVASDPPSDSASMGQPEADPVGDQPQTVLVFKDGHQLEVENYAIVGSTLYDLSDGHRRKIALSDLDLTATAKQNDDRGVDFKLPDSSQAN